MGDDALAHGCPTGWRRVARSNDDSGSSSIEFVMLLFLLVLPSAYLAITLASVQAASSAVHAAAVDVTRVLARSEFVGDPRDRVLSLLDERNIAAEMLTVTSSCAPKACDWPAGTVRVHITLGVGLPVIPTFIELPSAITVEHEAAFPVARFR